MKKCSKCGLEKELAAEFRFLRHKNRYSSVCKPCEREYKRDWLARTGKGREYTRAWQDRNREEVRRKAREYAAEHREERRAYMAAYVSNPENLAQKRASTSNWGKANRDKVRQSQRRQRAANPEAFRTKSRNARAKRAKADGSHTKEDVLRQLASQKSKCWWCGCRLKKYHVDHRIPLARGGTNDPANLVIACPPCNFSKNAKMPWEMESPRLL